MNNLLYKIFITIFFILISTKVFSKEITCVKGMVLIGKYNDNLTIKIDDDKKSVEIEGQSFISNNVSVYDELTKENLLTLQGDKTVGSKIYSFTYEESRNVISYGLVDTKDSKNNFVLLYECKG
ncbi:hypothetical protein OAT23_03470 [Candidatus Pelagibacter sp.]|nr:hypothetical protein [Candidatus Pelagibacter sp.]